MTVLETQRLVLRPWRDADLAPFEVIGADPAVMAYMPACRTPAESAVVAAGIRRHFEAHGYGLWALEQVADRRFVGYLGLSNVTFGAPFTPAVELAWMLARDRWGQGLATEAGRAVVDFAFDELGLASLVAFTTHANVRSRNVMARLGMKHDAPGDFLHPRLPEGHPLRPHVLYRLEAPRPARSRWGPFGSDATGATDGPP
jgi:ribosomal-protein-alanine N-acetyltransferase